MDLQTNLLSLSICLAEKRRKWHNRRGVDSSGSAEKTAGSLVSEWQCLLKLRLCAHNQLSDTHNLGKTQNFLADEQQTKLIFALRITSCPTSASSIDNQREGETCSCKFEAWGCGCTQLDMQPLQESLADA